MQSDVDIITLVLLNGFFLIFFWCFTSPLLCLEPTKSDYHDELIKIHTMFSFVSPLGIGNFLLLFFSVFYWNKEKGPMHIHRMCNRWRVVLWKKIWNPPDSKGNKHSTNTTQHFSRFVLKATFYSWLQTILRLQYASNKAKSSLHNVKK